MQAPSVAAITCKFNDPDEWVMDLERDRELVERNVVRLTKQARLSNDGTATMIEVLGSAIVDGRINRLVTYCGVLAGVPVTDTATQAAADQIARKLEDDLTSAGFELRAGAWE